MNYDMKIALADKAPKKFIVGATFWHRDWTGSLSRMTPVDIEENDAAIILFDDGRAVAALPSGRTIKVSARKQNWSHDGGREATRRTLLTKLQRHERLRAKAKAEERAALIAGLAADWRKSSLPYHHAPITSDELASVEAPRVAQFRRARKFTDNEALTFLESITIPDDLRDRYDALVAAREEKQRADDAVRAATKAREEAWLAMLQRARDGEIITSTEAGIDITSNVRPHGFPRALFDEIYHREILPHLREMAK